MQGHGHAASLGQGHRIKEPQRRRAVGQDQPRGVVRQTPSLAGIGEFTLGLEGVRVPEEALSVLPRQGQHAIAEDRQAFTEHSWIELAALQHHAILQTDLADRRRRATGAFQQHAVAEHQPLGEGARVMRIFVDDLETIDRHRRRLRRDAGRGGIRRLRQRRERRQKQAEQERRDPHGQTPGSAVSALFSVACRASRAACFFTAALRLHMFSTSTPAEKAMAA